MPNWKKVIVSGSNAELNSLNVTSTFTASGLNYPTTDNGEESFLQTNGSGDLSFQYVKTVYEEVYNGELTTISKGTPLYVSGSVGAASQVFAADASNASKMPVIYIAGDNIASGTTGRGIALGLITGVDTTGYPAGTEIYVAAGGGWTSTRPTGTNIVQLLGIVTKEGTGGQGVIFNPGPNSLPNLPSGNVWVGNSNALPTATTTSSLSVASAVNATNATNLNVLNSTTNASYPLVFSLNTTPGNKPLYTDNATTVYINPSTNVIGATTFIGALSGNATTSTTATQTTQAITFNNGGAGAASGTTFNGSTARTISYNTIGAQPLLTNPVTGTGTTNYLPKFIGSTTLGNSQIFDNGTNVGIGTTTPNTNLTLNSNYILGWQYTNSNAYIGHSISGGELNPLLFKWNVASASTYQAFSFEGSSSNKLLTILNGGNVGIGTATPLSYSNLNINPPLGNRNLIIGGTSIGNSTVLGSRVNAEGTGLDYSSYWAMDSYFDETTATWLPLRTTLGNKLKIEQSYHKGGILFSYSTNASPISWVDAMIIKNTGNVGIGTLVPDSKLHIQGDTQIGDNTDANGDLGLNIYGGQRLVTAGAPYIFLRAANTGGSSWGQVKLITTSPTNGDGVLTIQTSKSNTLQDRVVINQDGNVGIGTTSPNNILDAKRDQNSATSIIVTNDTNGTNARASFQAGSAGSSIILARHLSNYTVVPSWANSGVISTDSSISNGLVLRTGSGSIRFQSGTLTDQVVINNSGNVGIGTTSPLEKLDIAGNIKISGTGAFTGTVSGANATANNHFVTLSQLNSAVSAVDTLQEVTNNGNTTSNSLIVSTNSSTQFFERSINFTTGVGGWARDGFRLSNSGGTSDNFNIGLLGNDGITTYAYIGFGNYLSSKSIRISHSNGNVGINLTSNTQATEKLDVIGNVKATRFISTQATGTAPLTVSSTTKVANLNADLLDEFNSTDFTRNLNNIDASTAVKTFGTIEGINLINNSTLSTGFPTEFGFTVDFSTGFGISNSAYSRDFSLYKSAEERWYLSGYNTSGNRLPWREILHSGNLINPITGTGTTNYLPKFSGTSTITNSLIYDNGTNVGIGTTSPSRKLTITDSNGTTSIDGTGLNFNRSIAYIQNEFVGGGDIYIRQEQDNSKTIILKQSGNVGIGTTSPGAKLEISSVASNVASILASDTYARASFGQQSSSGDVHFGASGNAAPTTGSQDYGFYAAHNAFRSSTGAWKHTRTTTIPAVRLLGSGGVSSGNQGFSFDYSANVGTADITWTNLMQILPSGNVGIGTTSPGGKLDISYTGTGGAGTFGIGEGLNITSLSPNITFNDTSTSVDNYAVHLNQNVFTLGRYTSSTSQSPDLVLQAGKVGIGTTTISKKLEVAGDSSSGTFRLRPQDGTYQDYRLDITAQAADSGALTMAIKDNVFLKTYGYYNLTGLSLGVAGYTDLIHLKNSGNVGIGTTSPGAKLNVYETVENGGIILEGGPSVSNLRLTFKNSNATVNSSVIGINANSGVDGIIFQGLTDAYSFTRNIMTVLHNGKVGIGTTDPGAKLEVSGDVKISSEVTLSNYSNGVLSVNETGLIQVEPTFKNLSLGESYARIKQRYFLDNGYTVYPTDAGFQYAKLLQANLLRNASIFILPQATKTSLLGVEKGSDLTVVRATTATYVDENGVIQTALANVPRIDFTNGTGSILVEPQRTNLLLRSEEFDNASWTKTRTTVTANSTTAPDGNTTADKLIPSIDNNNHFILQGSIVVTAQIYSATIFAKKSGYDTVRLRMANFWSPTPSAVFNLTTKIVSSQANSTAKITELADDWFKLDITATVNAIAGGNAQLEVSVGNDGNLNFTGDGTSGLYIWGAQLEAGSNATSYIPTVASAVTRNADVISKTGISDLIGQTEGTIFVDCNLTKLNDSKNIVTIDNGSTLEYISLIRTATNIFRFRIKNSLGSAVNLIDLSVFNTERCKIAINYKNADYSLYVNGILQGVSNNSTSYPTTPLTQFILSNASYGQLNDSYNSVALWETKLTDQQCINLTSI